MSIDLPNRPFPKPYLFPVQDYDGIQIPANDESFDLVFSSNVLEHVHSLPTILSEIRRVMKPNATAIHILPTPVWRFWTSVTHYGNLLKVHLIPPLTASSNGDEEVSKGEAPPKDSFLRRAKRAMFSEAHGEYPNAVAELYYYSRRRWLRVFEENGFEMLEVGSNQLFYTGYALFPSLPVRTRRALSRLLGNSCLVYVMKRSEIAR
jgi:SAM-dependent methyltransferase